MAFLIPCYLERSNSLLLPAGASDADSDDEQDAGAADAWDYIEGSKPLRHFKELFAPARRLGSGLMGSVTL